MDAVNQKALEELAEYKKRGCHMLVPCMDQIAEVAQGFRLIVTPVFLRSHPKDKDVYPHDSTSYDTKKNDWKAEAGQGQYKRKIVPDQELVRVSGQGLEKLAQHVALVWDKPHIMIDKEFKSRQLCENAGAVRMPDGFSFYRMADAYGMDLDIVREQLEAQYREDNQKWLIDRDLLQKKANQTKLCISGSRNRIIRKILGVDGTYTVAALAKPFIAVRVIPWLDMNDAYTRKLVTEMNVKQMAITSLFGGQMPEQRQIAEPEAPPTISYEANIPADACHGDDDVMDYEEDGGAHYALKPEPELPPFAMPQEEPKPTTAESLRADFLSCDDPGQVRVLMTLITKKNAAKAVADWLSAFPGKTTVETMQAKSRITLYDHLVKLPDKERGK